jgi:septum formation protein
MRIILASASPRRKQLLAQAGIDFEVLVSDADENIDGEPYEQVAALARRKAEAVRDLLLREGALGETIIIAADTLVYAEYRSGAGKVLGKPRDEREAFEMLQTLQGRKHTVYTGVAILKTGGFGTVGSGTGEPPRGGCLPGDCSAGGSVKVAPLRSNAPCGNAPRDGSPLRSAGPGARFLFFFVFVDAAYVYFRPLTEREMHAYIATGEPFDKAGAYGIQEKGALLVERVEGDFYTVMGLPISKLCVQLEEMGVTVWP